MNLQRYLDRDLKGLDDDLVEQVSETTRYPYRAAAIGLVGVVLIIVTDLLYAGRPSPVALGAIALAAWVVESTVLGGARRLRATRRRWARTIQLERNEERRSIAAAKSHSTSRRALITAEIVDDDEEGADDDAR
jgi:hypothetical protein